MLAQATQKALPPNLAEPESESLGCRPAGPYKGIEAIHEIVQAGVVGKYLSMLCQVSLDDPYNQIGPH